MTADVTPSGSRDEVHFVAGATGYTGRHIVESLRRRGAVTWAHIRPDSRALEAWTKRWTELGAGVEALPWAASDFATALQRIRPTHVWSLLGTTKARADRDTGSAVAETYDAVDYGLTRLLYDAAATVTPAPTFVYLSAQGVREGTSNEYLAVRARLERELKSGPLPWIAARPAFISGGDRGESRPVERASAIAIDVALGALSAFGGRGLADRWRSATGAELAEGIVRCVVDKRRVNTVLDGRDWWPLLLAR
jgi:uncharacterized protein YbjT (DUF2867 family)